MPCQSTSTLIGMSLSVRIGDLPRAAMVTWTLPVDRCDAILSGWAACNRSTRIGALFLFRPLILIAKQEHNND